MYRKSFLKNTGPLSSIIGLDHESTPIRTASAHLQPFVDDEGQKWLELLELEHHRLMSLLEGRQERERVEEGAAPIVDRPRVDGRPQRQRYRRGDRNRPPQPL